MILFNLFHIVILVIYYLPTNKMSYFSGYYENVEVLHVALCESLYSFVKIIIKNLIFMLVL